MLRRNVLKRISKFLFVRLYWYVLENYVVKPKYRPSTINMIVSPSPHFFKTSPNRKVKFIVLHATASSTTESAVRWMKDPSSKVSAHYVIGKDGSVVQMVDLDNIAWHAGKSEWKGEKNVNGCSVAIELVNKDDGTEQYSDAQVSACLTITNALCTYYGIDGDGVIRHKDIAPNRKHDPGYLDFNTFKASLSFYQEKAKALS